MVSPPTFPASKFKVDLVSRVTTFMEKIEDAHVEECTFAKFATVANRLVNACLEVSKKLLNLSYIIFLILIFNQSFL